MRPKRSYGPQDKCKNGHIGDWYTSPQGITTCKACRRESSRVWQKKNAAEYKARQRQARLDNLDKYKEYDRQRNQTPERKRYMKNKNLLDKYGITIEEYERKLSNQNNKCAICKEELTFGRAGCVVDHDHATGDVRDILCSSCNKGIGHFKEDINRIRAIISYLEKWEREEPN